MPNLFYRDYTSVKNYYYAMNVAVKFFSRIIKHSCSSVRLLFDGTAANDWN